MLTLVDSGVLIAASHRRDLIGYRAVSSLLDPDREFASSLFVRLEVLPKPIYFHQQTEAQFYEDFFERVTHWAEPSSIFDLAYRQATLHGLAAMDALHIAAAIMTGAEELITTERPEKPIHRVTALRVISLHQT